jgi:hypothetical protein
MHAPPGAVELLSDVGFGAQQTGCLANPLLVVFDFFDHVREPVVILGRPYGQRIALVVVRSKFQIGLERKGGWPC